VRADIKGWVHSCVKPALLEDLCQNIPTSHGVDRKTATKGVLRLKPDWLPARLRSRVSEVMTAEFKALPVTLFETSKWPICLKIWIMLSAGVVNDQGELLRAH